MRQFIPERSARLWRLLTALALLVAATGSSAAAELLRLPVVAQVGPWPAISQMIVFRGRLWFTNSVLGVNHNSAEVHSLTLKTGVLRHERHLWSQAAGQPAVHAGLLYWPGEDPRLHGDWGAFQVTNGAAWDWGLIPGGGIFHVHAMAVSRNRLVAAVSAWKAGLAVSSDRGGSWRRIYTHPTPDRRVSRITALYPFGEDLVGELRAPEGRRLMVLRGETVEPLSGWPSGPRFSNLSPFQGALYGLVHDDQGTAVWRSDAKASHRVTAPRADWRPRALAADDDGLWAVEPREDGGIVWRSRDAVAWEPAWSLRGGTPREILATPAGLFVAGEGDDGRGVVWGVVHAGGSGASAGPAAMPRLRADATDAIASQSDDYWQSAGATLDGLLSDATRYQGLGRDIRRSVQGAVLAGAPAGFFAQRLKTPRPDGAINPFGDVVVPNRGSIGAFWLIWGMALSQNGRVPPAFISAPWSVPPNRAEKYFEPQLAAIWAVSVLDQRDKATLDALIGRTAEESDPLWLRLDAAGALSNLTEAGHGTDLAAWAAWWRRARPTWPQAD